MGRYSTPRYADLTNKRFGRLFVVALDHVSGDAERRVYWKCWCDCGAEQVVRADSLRSGAIQSCGCLATERRASANRVRSTTHGMSGTPTFRSWVGMRQRCANPNEPKFKDYGARGITVCDRWQSFSNFLADMGERPSGLTLDRKDVNGNYEPGNCRWADAKTQRNNRRDSVKHAA